MLLNKENYKSLLKGMSVIEVSGESCANCLSLMPILHNIMKSYPDVTLHHLEVDENTLSICEEFEVVAVPSILIMKDDQVFARCRGFQPEEILEIWMEAKIDELRKEFK